MIAITLTGAPGALPILDDIVPADWVDEWRHDLEGLDCRFVVLRPSLAVALSRNRARTIWTVDPALLAELHEMLGGPYTRDWLVIDNSEGSPEDAREAVIRDLRLEVPQRFRRPKSARGPPVPLPRPGRGRRACR